MSNTQTNIKEVVIDPSHVSGRVVIGKFVEVRAAVKRSTGEVIQGLFNLIVECEGSARSYNVELSFFDSDHGNLTQMQRQLEAAAPEAGNLVAVPFACRGKAVNGKAYVNYDALSIVVLSR